MGDKTVENLTRESIPANFLSLENLKKVSDTGRPVCIFHIYPKNEYIPSLWDNGEWAEVGIIDDKQNASILYVGANYLNYALMEDYGKYWFAYLENPFVTLEVE